MLSKKALLSISGNQVIGLVANQAVFCINVRSHCVLEALVSSTQISAEQTIFILWSSSERLITYSSSSF